MFSTRLVFFHYPFLGMDITTQHLLEFYFANQLGSALVQALPVPQPNGSVVYLAVYKFLSLVVADFKSFSATLPAPTITEVK